MSCHHIESCTECLEPAPGPTLAQVLPMVADALEAEARALAEPFRTTLDYKSVHRKLVIDGEEP